MPAPLEQQIIVLLIIAIFIRALFYRRPWRSWYAYGTAGWATENHLRKAGAYGKKGLLLGRTLRRRKPIRVRSYCHTSVYAPTGAGKFVSCVAIIALTYRKGSLFINDPKGEIYLATAKRRKAMGDRIIRIDPFNVCGSGADSFNPLDALFDNSQQINDALATAEAIVARPQDERDPYWTNAAVNLLHTMILATLILMKKNDCNLSTTREFLTDPTLFSAALQKLQEMGGIPARLAHSVLKEAQSEKQMAGVASMCNTHTAFLDSDLIAAAINKSTFSADVLLKPGTTVYFILPVEQMEAQRNFLRLVISSLIRHVLRHGVKRGKEVLFLLDEAAAAVGGLDAIAQALQLGRGKGIRLYMLWQDFEQAEAAFKKTPGLVAANCDVKVFFGINSFATAEYVSKLLGTYTLALGSMNIGSSSGKSYGSGPSTGGGQYGSSESRNYAEISRPLLFPAEVLQVHPNQLIAFIKGLPPVWGRRIFYFKDSLMWPWYLRLLRKCLKGLFVVAVVYLVLSLCSGR